MGGGGGGDFKEVKGSYLFLTNGLAGARGRELGLPASCHYPRSLALQGRNSALLESRSMTGTAAEGWREQVGKGQSVLALDGGSELPSNPSRKREVRVGDQMAAGSKS